MTVGGDRRVTTLLWGVVLLLSLVAMPATAWAGEGGIDPSFGTGGWSSTPLGILQGTDSGVEIGVGPEGSSFVAGSGGSIVRFDGAGSWDTGFGEGGELLFASDPAAEGVSTRSFLPHEIAVDGKGRLLVFGGESNSRRTFDPQLVSAGPVPETLALVLRYDGTGLLDPTFGAGTGYVRGRFGLHSAFDTSVPIVEAMAGTVDSQNRPVFIAGAGSVVGGCYAHAGTGFLPRAIVRLDEAGGPDRTFGDNGASAVTGTAAFPWIAADGADQPVAELGPTGGSQPQCHPGNTLVRLRANGGRLRGFGDRGALRLKQLRLAVVEPSGALLVDAGHGRTLEVARIGAKGRRVESFGRQGIAKVQVPPGSGGQVKPVAVDGSGRILLAGYVGKAHSAFVVGRLLADGRPDPGFGNGGWLVVPVPDSFEVNSTAATLDPQGRLIVAAAGTSKGQNKNGYLVARFLLGP
jgi:uncharacterized delta-60 repeat protein